VDFYECAHTQCFCKRSGGGEYNRIRGMCYSSRSQTDVLTARFRKSHTPLAVLLCIIWAAAAPALHFCDKSRSVAGGDIIKIDTRPILYLHIPRLWYNTLCTSYNNIIRTHILSSFYNAALDRNILISYIYYYAYNIYIYMYVCTIYIVYMQ